MSDRHCPQIQVRQGVVARIAGIEGDRSEQSRGPDQGIGKRKGDPPASETRKISPARSAVAARTGSVSQLSRKRRGQRSLELTHPEKNLGPRDRRQPEAASPRQGKDKLDDRGVSPKVPDHHVGIQ